jgi:hypothetical protein
LQVSKIEKGIPLPKRELRSPVSKRIRELKVGESFRVSATEIQRPNLYVFAKAAGITVTIKVFHDEKTGETTYGVWRTS